MPPERPPVVIKSPKLLVPEAAPPLQSSEVASPNDNTAIKAPSLAKTGSALPAISDSMGAGSDSADLNRDDDPSIRFDEVTNPLRNDIPSASSSDESLAALNLAKNNQEEDRQMRTMARAMPAPSPLPIPSLDAAASEENSTEFAPMPSPPVAPAADPSALPDADRKAALPLAASMGGANNSVVKVFYGTDRAALSSIEVKNDLIRKYSMWAIIAACWAFIFALLAFKFLRWRSMKALYLMCFSAAVVLGSNGRICGHLRQIAESPDGG